LKVFAAALEKRLQPLPEVTERLERAKKTFSIGTERPRRLFSESRKVGFSGLFLRAEKISAKPVDFSCIPVAYMLVSRPFQ
jgi:hypothetical protein